MKRKRLTKSTRKFIRSKKARIRREILSSEKQEELIQQLYKKFDKGASSKKEFVVPKKKTIVKAAKKAKATKATKATKKTKTKKSISKKE